MRNRRARVMLRIRSAVEASGEQCALLTLTSQPGTTPARMMSAWRLMWMWLKRQNPEAEYAAVKQFGSLTGMLHLHVVLIGWQYLKQGQLSRRWERHSGARVVDIRRKEGGKAARYVSRYLSRTVGEMDLRKCVTYSRGFPALEKREKRWRVVRTWDGAGVPPGPYVGVAGGCLVVRDVGCDCLEKVREVGLDGHLFLRGIERGPPLEVTD